MKNWLIVSAIAGGFGLGAWLLIRDHSRKNKAQKQAELSRQASNTPKGTALEEPNWHDPFDMNYQAAVQAWIAPRKLLLPDENTAGELAYRLKSAKGKGFFSNDDEAAVENVFARQLRDKVALSRVAGLFYQKYEEDLWEHLRSFLSESELETYIRSNIRNMPNYRIG